MAGPGRLRVETVMIYRLTASWRVHQLKTGDQVERGTEHCSECLNSQSVEHGSGALFVRKSAGSATNCDRMRSGFKDLRCLSGGYSARNSKCQE